MRGGHHDRVERRGVRQALAPVADHDGRVLDALLREVRRGRRRELGDPLDAPHLPRQPREQGGLIAEAGAHLQNALLATQAERFEHHGDQRGLARELPTADPDRAVTLGLTRPLPGTYAARGTSAAASSTRGSRTPAR